MNRGDFLELVVPCLVAHETVGPLAGIRIGVNSRQGVLETDFRPQYRVTAYPDHHSKAHHVFIAFPVRLGPTTVPSGIGGALPEIVVLQFQARLAGK
jgi:hypothetical protein